MLAEHTPYTDAADLAACERLMRGGSKSFFAASRVLPHRVRTPAIALYAFCRLADDAIDLAPDPVTALTGLMERLRGIYDGAPAQFAADRAFAAVVRGYDIPPVLPVALLEGFEWDTVRRQYETLSDLNAYAARVAGTVGAMMALIMGVRTPTALARACELGVAMQLTNIARDVGEDARAGRLYLPLAWMRETGIEPQAWLRNPVFDARLGAVVARLLAAADALYVRAESGIRALPRDCRASIMAARLVYAEIGREVEYAGFDSVSRRAVVSGRRKVALMARSLAAAASVGGDAREPNALPEVQFMIDATVARDRTSAALARRSRSRRNIDQRIAWVFELFLRLAERDRANVVFGRLPKP